MRKTPKTYRLSPITCRELQRLKELEPKATETELVERAITHLLMSYGTSACTAPAPSHRS